MNSNIDRQKVFVALSGGVDSAVSAALLVKQGYDVTGVYMKNWSGDDFGIQDECPWEEDQKDAEAVCKHLEIPFRSFNFEKQYRQKVVDYFFEEYKKGRTPNPDVMCNKEIKFKLFLDKALQEGANLIATGHYARTSQDTNEKEISEKKLESEVNLLTGIDETKNQVYFLYNITQQQLSKTLFPIGEFPKSKVREMAKEFGLPNANKPDSQGICFIGKIDVLQFLLARIPENPGEIIDIETNNKVGEHKGIYFYTLGQRAKIANQPVPYFYCKKNVEKNIMYVCHGSKNEHLYSSKAELESLHIINTHKYDVAALRKLQSLTAMIRYRQTPQPGKIVANDSKLTFVFDQPQRAIASGQSLVLFNGQECIGGGVIG